MTADQARDPAPPPEPDPPQTEAEEPSPRAVSEVLRDILEDSGPTISIFELMRAFGPRAFGAMLFVFSAPNLLPLPPGSSTVLGAPLVLVAPQLAVGRRAPWIPRFAGRRTVSRGALRTAFSRLLPWVEKIERLSQPRLTFLFGPVGDRVLGLVCFLLALVLILPIPLGNLLPAAAVAVLSLSLVQRDGALALLGYGLAGISVAVLALSAGVVIAAAQRLLQVFGV